MRPVFWLVLALIALGLLGAIQWDHPQASIIAKIFGAVALVSLILSFLTFNRNDFDGSLASSVAEGDIEGVMVTDSRGTVIYTNPAFNKLLSFAATASPSRRFESLEEIKLKLAKLNVRGIADVERLISEGLDGRPAAVEFAVLDRKVSLAGEVGSAIWRSIRVAPMKKNEDTNTRVTHIIWRISDITNRREIEQVRLEEQGRTNDLLDFLPIGVFSADGDGIILYANQTLAHWLGRPPERLIGTAFGDYVTGVGDYGSVSLKDGEGRDFSARLEQTQKEASDGDVAYTRSIVVRNVPLHDTGSLVGGGATSSLFRPEKALENDPLAGVALPIFSRCSSLHFAVTYEQPPVRPFT